ncbi:MerR family transcriptional regulator [Virgibacillus sp. NKC19-3]|uniref:MerR family transcriptional regulator n=1 Tax=Virgibacillus saliphilus TaxID=2831674 RepID=UPI001C9A5F92|nr:MerR family transcriptional regulator [Virgibacillus sp. NKC19-3]MBY7141559.1 MerR family transcriptional regulator [Virgibacillus sp. NKC19-3]
MLTVKQAADKVSISPSTIRYYDDEGLLPFIERSQNGYRMFKEEDLFWLEMIGCMRETNMSIETLRHVAHLHMEGSSTLEERTRIFKDHKTKLQMQKKNIDDALDKLETKMNILESYPTPIVNAKE